MKMPKINYSDMPYEKKYSTGEKKQKNIHSIVLIKIMKKQKNNIEDIIQWITLV